MAAARAKNAAFSKTGSFPALCVTLTLESWQFQDRSQSVQYTLANCAGCSQALGAFPRFRTFSREVRRASGHRTVKDSLLLPTKYEVRQLNMEKPSSTFSDSSFKTLELTIQLVLL